MTVALSARSDTKHIEKRNISSLAETNIKSVEKYHFRKNDVFVEFRVRAESSTHEKVVVLLFCSAYGAHEKEKKEPTETELKGKIKSKVTLTRATIKNEILMK